MPGASPVGRRQTSLRHIAQLHDKVDKMTDEAVALTNTVAGQYNTIAELNIVAGTARTPRFACCSIRLSMLSCV